ncbi:MAG TPA: polysaccharide deacetylase family protein [Gaiellaceae bacterium]
MTEAGGSPVSPPQGSRSRGLALPPLPFYVLKAGVTRAQSTVWLLRSRRRHAPDGIRILFYHRVSDDRDELAVTRGNFRLQMDYLAGEGYRVIDVLEAATLLDAGDPPEKTVALSFDDGYRDVAEHAAPLLAQYGFRATVFVAPGVTDGTASFAWYRQQPPLLGWDEIKALDADSALGFEAHSLTHPNLLELSDEDARREISGSKLALEERLGRAVTAFSYPAGLFGPREQKLVAEAGFRVAVSCEPGVNEPGTERLALRRRQIDARDRLLDFRAKVGGGHDSPPPFRGAYRRFRFGADDPSPIAASSRR